MILFEDLFSLWDVLPDCSGLEASLGLLSAAIVGVTAKEDAKSRSRAEDIAIVQAIREGDTAVYRDLVQKYQQRVYTMVYGMLRDQEDARDVTQDAFVKAYTRLDSFRLESSFYTWLYRIAMNLAIDVTRRRKRRPTAEFDESVARKDGDGMVGEEYNHQSPGKALERKQLHKRIMEAVQELPEDQRQVILLRELEGLPYKEISEILGVAEGTVMSRLFYARKRLQKTLADLR